MHRKTDCFIEDYISNSALEVYLEMFSIHIEITFKIKLSMFFGVRMLIEFRNTYHTSRTTILFECLSSEGVANSWMNGCDVLHCCSRNVFCCSTELYSVRVCKSKILLKEVIYK